MNCSTSEPGRKMNSAFERYLTVWVGLCIIGGILLGKVAPGLARTLDGMSIFVNGAPVVSIPIAICLFFMMYPIMVKIDFARVVKAGQTPKPVLLTLFINWAVKPFTMFFIASAFLLWFHRLGLLPGTEVVKDGSTVDLYRSYIAGAILLGIAPCTAMVLVWNYLVRGNDGLTLVMVAVNSLTMLLLYGALGGWLLGLNEMPVPWETLLLSVGIYVALPLVAGYFSRKWIIQARGESLVPGKIPARTHPGLHHCAADHPRAAVQLQGRNHPRTTADHSVDRHPAVPPDPAHLLHHLRAGPLAQAAVRGCRARRDDRRLQPL
jgi:ACR3 family arsenite transporter